MNSATLSMYINVSVDSDDGFFYVVLANFHMKLRLTVAFSSQLRPRLNLLHSIPVASTDTEEYSNLFLFTTIEETTFSRELTSIRDSSSLTSVVYTLLYLLHLLLSPRYVPVNQLNTEFYSHNYPSQNNFPLSMGYASWFTNGLGGCRLQSLATDILLLSASCRAIDSSTTVRGLDSEFASLYESQCHY